MKYAFFGNATRVFGSMVLVTQTALFTGLAIAGVFSGAAFGAMVTAAFVLVIDGVRERYEEVTR